MMQPSVEQPAVEKPWRARRPIALTFSPDIYILHVQEFADAVIAPLVVRLTGNLTPRIFVTGSYGGAPNILRVYDVGAAVALFDTPVTPYAGFTAGILNMLGDDSPGHKDGFVAGVIGVTFVSRGGLELAAEGAAGYQREEVIPEPRDSVLLRMGIRVGYRFAFGS
jgi:hypothetical protein